MTISIPVGPIADGVAEEYDWDAESSFSMGGELPEWRLVVAPARGIFHATSLTSENTTPLTSENRSGTEVGHIEARRDRQPIVAPWRGSIIEWLVQDGDPVGLGQPVARLLPDDAELGAIAHAELSVGVDVDASTSTSTSTDASARIDVA
jgi:multidrug efflux pump subunit AcrA (membrane-fusion protein)